MNLLPSEMTIVLFVGLQNKAGLSSFDIQYIRLCKYPYFDVVVELCGHMIPRAKLAVAYATGRASHARQVKGDNPDKKGYPGPPGWGFGVGLTTPHSKKLIVMKVEQKKLDGFNDDGESW
jgi:hypothetical protein